MKPCLYAGPHQFSVAWVSDPKWVKDFGWSPGMAMSVWEKRGVGAGPLPMVKRGLGLAKCGPHERLFGLRCFVLTTVASWSGLRWDFGLVW